MTVVVRTKRRLLSLLLFTFLHAAAWSQLSANFTSAPATSGCSPLVVSFTDQSAGNPTQWKWDLGNGVTSLLRNPSTTYFNPGTYSIKLVIKNSAGSDSLTKTNYITVYQNPTADFTADKTTGCFPLAVNFTDGSLAGSGTITSWVWDFGDGNTSTQQMPSHTYTAAGNYTVTLRVINSAGCSKTVTRAQYISIATGITADFTATDPGLCPAPSIVNFTNTSTGPGPLAYAWLFGDGATSAASNPSHTYAGNGSYSVTLIAVSPQGCVDTVRKNNLINPGSIQASFTGPDTVCVNTAATFTNTSIPAPLSAVWALGNGTFSTALHATATYTAPGTYTIKLVSQFGGCADSATHLIYVSPKPQPAFTADNNIFCSVPAVVNFTNQSAGGASVSWDFGDGTTSTTPNPTHIYTAEGSYTISLTITNAAGCSETLTRPAFIQIQKPQASIAGLPRTGCAPITINPTVTLSTNHTISSYLWSFGDGATSTSASPAHTYSGTGTYTVSLVYTTTGGCTDSIVLPAAVRVGTKPHAAFTLTPKDACAFQSIQFTDGSTGGADQWFWIFGDGGTSSLQNPTYQYSDTGYFHVQLIVYNNTCPDTILIMNAVHIKPPIAAFVVRNDCADKYTKTFTDRSIGATSWFWTFGDGGTSTQQSPAHTYAATGVYTVRLTVSNDTCQNSFTQTVRVIDEKAAFTTDSISCRNQTVIFTSSGINGSNIASWQWNFGDGSTANFPYNASHVYTASGTYTASLIITDLLGCNDTTFYTTRVYGPVADFTVPVTISCLVNNAILFTDLSAPDASHPITKWEWNFGDGAIDTSNTAPWIHSYAGAGNYTVSLLVRDSYGCTDVVSKAAAILISQPVAGFSSPDTLTCTGRPVQFTNTSAGNNPQYQWAFGDGNSSAAVNPLHTYAGIGAYTVKLVVTDQYGCKDSVTHPDYIFISYPKAVIHVSDSISTCPPLLVNFWHSATDYTSLTWNFGDGTGSLLDSPSHFYTAPGIYYATLTAQGPGGCTDVAMQKIEIKGPSGSFTYAPLSGCKPLMVTFTGTAKNNATYTWDFADGTIAVTADSTVAHTYTVAGEFVPKLILTDAGGCSVAIPGPDTVRVTGISAGFSMAPNTFCNDGIVQFTNTTVGNDFITSYHWDFGDGAVSSAQHPSHHYTSPGFYTVSLNVVSQSGCRDSLRYIDTVKIWANPLVSVSHDPSGCTPVTIAFHGNILLGDSSHLAWAWDFGNGISGSLQHPVPQTYSVANAYTVHASVTDDNGCRHDTSVVINAHPIPVIDAGPDVAICRGAFTQLNATGGATYNWHTASSLSCTACQNPLAAPTDSTQYTVTGSSNFGCTAIDSVAVKVYQPFTLQVGPGDTVCSGGRVQLQASGTDFYTWIPATAVANASAGTTTAVPTTTTLYKVVAKDRHNCFTDTGYVAIKVWPYPTVNAGPDKTVSIGSTVLLQPVYSADVTTHAWSNHMATLSCTTCPAPTVTTKSAKHSYSIEVRNEGGCLTKDDITVYAICNGANLFIPNTFSPNADGRNDKFYPRGSGLNLIKSLSIYDRWGELVFRASNLNPNDAAAGWDGRYKGKLLPPDVYVYTCEVICINNEVLTYNGNVTLLR